MSFSARVQGWLPALGTSVPLIVLPIAILSIPLAAAQEMGLSAAETTSWILALFGLPGALSLVLLLRYRQPLLMTGNVFMLIFIASLGTQLSYAELIGAAVVAGGCVVLVSLLGLTDRLAAWIPAPVVLGLLAGAVLPFVVDVFTLVGEAPVLAGGTLLAYLLGQFLWRERVPAIFPAVVVGLVLAAFTGQLAPMPSAITWPVPVLTLPVFSLPAIITATPVMIILITLQANVPSLIFLQNQAYDPPQSVVNVTSGVGTLMGSLAGPTGVSLSLPVTSLTAGPGAGDHALRHRAGYIAGGAVLLLGLLGGVAADLPQIVPMTLLLTLAGLALIDVLTRALKRVTQGPLVFGPLFAFVIVLSDISLLGLGPLFWGLVIGTGVTFLLERKEATSRQAEK